MTILDVRGGSGRLEPAADDGRRLTTDESTPCIQPYKTNSGGGLVAKDALGDDVTVEGWLSTHLPGDRSLVQGLKGDATYLIVKEDKTIEEYGLNAVCTHLGCVVPWNKAENKFICPCHASQYDETGASPIHTKPFGTGGPNSPHVRTKHTHQQARSSAAPPRSPWPWSA